MEYLEFLLYQKITNEAKKIKQSLSVNDCFSFKGTLCRFWLVDGTFVS